MEKHSAYCAMVRLGLKVPPTTLVPYKNPVDNVRWAYTSEKYNENFDLDAIADELGYPLYMKPFDGGGWRGVSRVNDRGDLHKAYDESGEMLMHLQSTIDFEHFARALSIGPETMVMDFKPDLPMHQRYAGRHGFLSESAGFQAAAISRIVNAFFLWEFNSCEMLVSGDEVHPIDYANACPDVAVTSLHYYFPWAITALVRWSVYCVVTGRKQAVDLSTGRYFAIADDPDMSYDDKIAAYLELADAHFDSRALLGVLRRAPRAPARAGPRLGDLRRVRPDAARHRRGDVPGPRAGGVPGALPRAGRAVGERPGDQLSCWRGRTVRTMPMYARNSAMYAVRNSRVESRVTSPSSRNTSGEYWM